MFGLGRWQRLCPLFHKSKNLTRTTGRARFPKIELSRNSYVHTLCRAERGQRHSRRHSRAGGAACGLENVPTAVGGLLPPATWFMIL